MSDNLDRAAIIATLKREALTTPEEGWVSDLGSWDLEWSEFDEAIVLGYHEGSIDVGHLAGIVENLIETATKPFLRRAEAAEQTVERVRELASEYRKTIPEEVLHSVMVDICRTLDGGEQK